MKRLQILLFFCLHLFVDTNLQAQNQPEQGTYSSAYKQNIVPPSPTAASLGKYGDIPVSQNTGLPSISVPIHTVQSGELQMQVSLGYHSSGIKVGEEASWVGLGWSLNAGGVITRTVRGRPDEMPEKILSPTPLYNVTSNPVTNMGEFVQLTNIAENNIDSQPDIFFYNIGGKSGKFLDSRTQQYTINPLLTEFDNLKIQYMGNTNSFVLTDAQGIQYFFGGANAIEVTNTFPVTTNQIAAYVSSWYLTKMLHPKGDSIIFEYANHTYSKTQVGQDTYAYEVRDVGSPPDEWCLGALESGYSVSNDVTITTIPQTRKLKKIIFYNGFIEFNTSSRYDVTNDVALTNIKIFRNDKVEPIRSFNFVYDYFITEGSNYYGRLKLLSLREIAAENQTKPPHTFEYIEGYFTSYRYKRTRSLGVLQQQ